MQNCAGSSKLCEKRLVVRIYGGNGLKCEYVRETAKSAIPHPPHLICKLDMKFEFAILDNISFDTIRIEPWTQNVSPRRSTHDS